MPDHLTLLHAIPGTGLDPVIERFLTSLNANPLGTFCILPTHRLIRTVADRLSAAQITFIPDQLCTLDQFCEGMVSRYGGNISLIKPQTARIILADVLKKMEKDLSLFFVQRTPSPKTLQDLQMLISVIIRREIDYPGCLTSLQTEKSKQIERIITGYTSRLSERNLVDKDTLLKWTIEFLNNHPDITSTILVNTYFFGLFEPLPLEKKLITTILEKSTHAQYLIAEGKDPLIFADTGQWIDPKTQEHIACPDVTAQKTAIFRQEQGSKPGPLPGISLASFTDPTEEMRQIAEEIIRITATGTPYSDITIAFPDLRYALSYAPRIFPDYDIPYTSSSGPLLTQYPVISYYMQFFEMVEKGLRFEDVASLLQSPFISFWYYPTPDDSKDASENSHDGQKSHRLLYKNVEIISRTYGITNGYVDWERQKLRILEIISNQERSPPLSGETSQTDTHKGPHNPITQEHIRKQKGYGPERPLPTHIIETTLEGIAELMKVLGTMMGKKTIREHISQFMEIMKLIGSPVPHAECLNQPSSLNLSEEEKQVILQFGKILTELAALARSGTITSGIADKEVSTTWFIGILRILVQDTTGEVDSNKEGVLLTGIRELAHQHYPHLFIASLNEGLIPRLSTRLPFTNGSENSKMETRTLGDILREEKYQFITALLAGEQVYLSYHQHREERTVLSSPFIDTLSKTFELPRWGEETEPMQHQRCAHSNAAKLAGEYIRSEQWNNAIVLLDEKETLGSVLHRISVERNFRFRLNRSEYDGILAQTTDIIERLNKKFGPNYRWSASMLESYARCPFRFYLERVVRIRPLADMGGDITPMAKGSLIHTVLCRFIRQMKDEEKLPLRSSSYHEAVATITKLAEDEFELVPYQTTLWSAKKKQLIGGSNYGTGIFEKFVAAEIDRLSPPEEGLTPALYTPRLCEFSFGAVPDPDDDPLSQKEPVDLAEIAQDIISRKDNALNQTNLEKTDSDIPGNQPSLHACSHPVYLSGKIDRVDITPDGQFGIVDYKTGIKVPSSTEIGNMKALQLPLYIQAFQKISGNRGVYGSYCQVHRTINHSISLYDPAYKKTLPMGKLPRSEPEWEKILDTAVFNSCSHVSAIHAGIFPIQPCTKCNADWYCPYASICRFQPDRGSRLCEWLHYPLEHKELAEEGE